MKKITILVSLAVAFCIFTAIGCNSEKEKTVNTSDSTSAVTDSSTCCDSIDAALLDTLQIAK